MTEAAALQVHEVIRRISSDNAQVRVAFIDQCPPTSMQELAMMAARMNTPEMRPQAIDYLASGYVNTGPYDAAAALGEATYRLARSMYEDGRGDRWSQRAIAGRGALNWVTGLVRLGKHEQAVSEIAEPLAWLHAVGDTESIGMLQLKRVEAEMNLQHYEDARAHLQSIEERALPPLVRVSYRAHAMRLEKLIGGGEEMSGDIPIYAPDDLLELLGGHTSNDRAQITKVEGQKLTAAADALTNHLFGGGQGAVNEFTVRQEIVRAGYLFTDEVKGRNPVEIAKIIPVLIRAREWMHEHGFEADEGDACWTLYLCYSRTNRENLAARELQRLRTIIEGARSEIVDPKERERISARYPYLYEALATMLFAVGDAQGLLEAIEASKGRVLADLQTLRRGQPADEAMFSESLRGLPPILRKLGATYLTYLVDDDVTYAVVMDRHGELSTHRIEIKKTALEAFAQSKDPRFWGKRDPTTLERSLDIGTSLAPLVNCLQGVARDPEARHVCYSASGPLLSLPLHCALLGGKRLAMRFSISRIHGAAALYQILSQDPQRPRAFLSLEVPAVEDQGNPEKLAALSAPGAWLEQHMPSGLRLRAEAADLRALQSQATQKQTIHFGTHGTFPNPDSGRAQNPFYSSGIALAENGRIPQLNALFADGTYLLTPSEIVEKKLDFTQSHITLTGCVTGLAKASVAGDALGLEYALLQVGAQSVLSSHWDCDAKAASKLIIAFYRRWLTEGKSRAVAWHEAMLEAVDEYGDTSGGAYNWAALSLIGDWR